ncbi:hypothetical protein EST38_g5885 [Candolleomyces aberdarensis]|uniref:Uncharacterized protein n=1 Tax=Candolleomyces aberdarensis TaxID=2316362 RepID=A0A4Q2DMM2_9AGAR|nr:hypothetical protein EST38_g5885 [Candolleomyces aberdarensis]
MPVDPTKVVEKPGHGHPFNWAPESRDAEDRAEPFPKALVQNESNSGVLEPITLRELTMLRLMNKITDKPDWTTKVFDETFIAKWKDESVNLPDSSPPTQMSERMFAYCMLELQYRSKEHSKSPNGAIRIYNGDVYKSDTAVSDETKLALQRAVRVLEDVPDAQKDWHPGSDGKVLDLVHPSLFPLIYDTSRILSIGAPITTLEDCVKRCGEGEVLPGPKAQNPSLNVNDEDAWSAKFQWLPCEVDISSNKPKIVTYINNLHPKHHKELYGLMEDLIQAAIPLWNLTLVRAADLLVKTPKRIHYDDCSYDPDPASWPEADQVQQEDGEDDHTFLWRKSEWIRNTRVPEQPEPSEFDPNVIERDTRPSLMEKYGGLPLQVIVKLANIELTPEKPEYEGGMWHVEGKLNESICATAIYCYSSENITSSSLAFRQQGSLDYFLDVTYEQGAHDWLPDVFGLQWDGNTVQDVGSVETCEGRLITFPNILQHRVQPFKLADPTKTGHRKIVALFLVDPNVRVISTADVPCQRQEWWWDEILNATSSQSSSVKPIFADIKAGGVHRLPPELRKIVFDVVDDFPISMDRARAYREKLMEERKKFVLKHQEDFASMEISSCVD